MSLLTIIQGTALRSNLPVPTSAISNPDGTIAQMLAFCQDTCQDLSERWDWRNLKSPAIVRGDGASTLWLLPSDWQRLDPSDKSPISPLISNIYPLLPLTGPVNDDMLNQYKQFGAPPTRPVWRIIGNVLELWPALAANETISLAYFSNFFILNKDGLTRQPQWINDADTSLIPEDTIMKGTIWRWKSSKGLDYAEDMRQYEMSATRQAGAEGQERTVSTAFPPYSVGPEWWPGPIIFTPS